MKKSIEEKAVVLNELSYLYAEHGGALSDDETDIIKISLSVAQKEGLEFIGDDVWEVLFKIYHKYENKEIIEDDGEGEDGY